VRTALGGLLGTWANREVARFAGIPFAAPPVGELRWRAPRPAARWSGPRPADRFGPAPLQSHPPKRSLMYRANFDEPVPSAMSEDCLYLNVWTPDPAPNAGLPVLVFLQGGGNRFGHGGQRIHDGAALARHGIVVVTLNYRLGALGFLAHPGLATEDPDGASGNYALADVLAALRWIAEHIGAFGGDPGRVTLGGNSAGAAIACHLMTAGATRGLVHRVIGQSASGAYRAEGPLPEPERAQREGAEFAAHWADDIAALRAVPGVELVLPGHFGPVVDGALLTEQTGDVLDRGGQLAVPLLAGSNADEGVLYTRPDAVEALRGRPSEVLAAYPADDPEQARRSAREFTGDSRFGYPVWRWATTHARTSGAPTFLYRFTQSSPLPPDLAARPAPDGGRGYGSFHTAELPYLTGNLDALDWPWTEQDHALSRRMREAWSSFVDSGNPGGGWPASTGDTAMVFGPECGPAAIPDLDRMRLLDRLPRPLS
jgi:para-nitrobenzyl esterase